MAAPSEPSGEPPVWLTGVDQLSMTRAMTVEEADRLSEEGKGFWVTMHPDAEPIAKEFHAAYEGLAPFHGYETREASAKPWEEVPTNNRELMIATVDQLLRANIIRRVRPRDPLSLDSHSVHTATTTVETGDKL